MKRSKKVLSYAEAHNKAVNSYKKVSMFMLWGGLLNIFALIIGIVQISTNNVIESLPYSWPTSGFAMTYSIQIFFANILLSSIDSLAANLISVVIALILSAGFGVLSMFASRGRLACLISGMSLYAIDFVFMFFLYKYFAPYIWTNYAFTLATHVVILASQIYALAQYYNVLNIEKRYKGNNNNKIKINTKEEIESEVIANGK